MKFKIFLIIQLKLYIQCLLAWFNFFKWSSSNCTARFKFLIHLIIFCFCRKFQKFFFEKNLYLNCFFLIYSLFCIKQVCSKKLNDFFLLFKSFFYIVVQFLWKNTQNLSFYLLFIYVEFYFATSQLCQTIVNLNEWLTR